MKTPYLFDEFFASGMEESISPFLTQNSKGFGKNLNLRTSGISALLLALAFALSFTSPPLSYLLLSFVYFLVGVPALIAAISDLKNLEINIDVLMTLAAFAAVFLNSGLEGALLLVLFELSRGLEKNVSKRARSAIHNLNNLAPKIAFVIDADNTLYEKAVREIKIGDHLLVKNGEIVPLDGKVIAGSSSVNLVHLTGESIPVPKKKGDTVPAGARNLESALTIEVNRTSSDSTLTKIMQLIIEAQAAKPGLQRWLDRFGSYYATTVILLTFAFALLLPFLLNTDYSGHEGSIYRSLAFLIAASPCALIIATPTAYLSAISACAKRGILLKGGITLDALASCVSVAFDKTGTLTTGNLVCTGIDSVGSTSIDENTAIAIAYGLEKQVVHPIATAICNLAILKNIDPVESLSFRAIPGSGIEGTFGSKKVLLGLPDWVAKSTKLSISGVHAALAVGEDLFLFRFSDEVRTSSAALIEKMKTVHGLKTIMLTGDHESSAIPIGKELGLDEIFANLRPVDKLTKVIELTQFGALAMVGDGINDAPALARATVGISMGKIGSATAVDASDVVLLNDDLHLLSWLFTKSRQTRRIVKQNLTLALSVICLATIPALLGLVPLWAAVLMHEGGTVLVGLNSLRLLRKT